MFLFGKRVGSSSTDSRSQHLRTTKRFQDKLDVDIKKSMVHIVLAGQEDEISDPLVTGFHQFAVKELCSQCEEQFNILPQVTDMRIGARLNTFEDFRELLAALEGIDTLCNNQYVYVVFFVSDRATKPRVPPVLPADFFENISKYDILLKRRYMLNTNCIPSTYELNRDAIKDDKDADRLSNVLQKALQEAYTLGNDAHRNLFISDVGHQFQSLMSEQKFRERGIGIISSKRLKTAATYTVLKELTTSRLVRSNVFSLSSGGLDSSTGKDIAQALHSLISCDIETHSKTIAHRKVCQDIHQSVLSDCHLSFIGRHNHVNRMKSYLQVPGKKCPLIVYGGTGYGKSALVVNCIRRYQKDVGKNVIVIYRSIGKTDNSKTFEDIILSVVSQLADQLPALERTISQMLTSKKVDNGEQMSRILSVLGNAASKRSKKLVFVFDDVADIEPKESVLKWIPQVVPSSVSMVLCMDSSKNGLLDCILEHVKVEDSCLLRIDTLPEEEAVDICQIHCSKHIMKLTREQIKAISDAFYQCRQVAYLKMILQHSVSWRSNDDVKVLRIGRTVRLTIQVLFEDIEKCIGVELASTVLSFFASVRAGLRLDELFQIAHMDQRSGPHTNLLLVRLLRKISPHLHVSLNGASRTLVFRSSEFVYVIRKRYMSTTSKSRRNHSILATYFMKPKNLFKTLPRRGDDKKVVKSNPLGGGSRKSATVSSDTIVQAANFMRTVQELPHHLVLANRLTEFCSICCTMQWIHIKLCLFSLVDVVKDFHEAAQFSQNLDICYISGALTSAQQKFYSNDCKEEKSEEFARDILSKLKGYQLESFPFVSHFVESVESFLQMTKREDLSLNVLNSWSACNGMSVSNFTVKKRVNCLCMSDDKENVILGYENGIVELRSLSSGKLRKVWKPSEECVKEVSFNQKCDKIYCKLQWRFAILDIRNGEIYKSIEVANDCTVENTAIGCLMSVNKTSVHLVNLQTEETSHIFHAKENTLITGACLSKSDEFYVVRDEEDIAVIDLELEKAHQSNSAKPVTELGPCLLASMSNGAIQVWSIETSKSVKCFEAHAKSVSYMEALSSSRVLSLSKTRGMRIHNWHNGRLLHKTLVPSEAGSPMEYKVRIDQDERFIAVAGGCQIFVWETETLISLKVFFCHSGPVTDIQLSDVSQDENVAAPVVISAGKDCMCRMWSIADNKEIAQFQLNNSSDLIVANECWVMICGDSILSVYQYQKTSLPNPAKYCISPLTCLGMDEDGAVCLCEPMTNGHGLVLKDATDGSPLALQQHEEIIIKTGFCKGSDSLLLCLCTKKSLFVFYSVQTLKEVNCFHLKEEINRIDMHQNSESIVILNKSGRLLVYNASQCSLSHVHGILTLPLVVMSKPVPDTDLLLYVSQQTKLYVIDVVKARVVHERCMAEQRVVSLAYCPANQYLAHSKGGPSIWTLDLDNYTKAFKLNMAVKGNITHMEYINQNLLTVDSTSTVSIVDPVNDCVICRCSLGGSIQCLTVSGSYISMLVDGHVARIRLQKSKGKDIIDLDDFLYKAWKTLHNTLGISEGALGYVGHSMRERICWGQETSALPAQCVIS